MALISVDRSKYTKGSKGLRITDTVADALDGLTLEQVYAVGEGFIPGVAVGELQAKYATNNPGQQRMHVGNRLRKAVKAEGFLLSHFNSLCEDFRSLNADAASTEEQRKTDTKAAAVAAKAAKPAKAKKEKKAA